MQLPPLPRIPIDLSREEKEFLTSLDGKIDSLLVAGRENDKLYAMGSREGYLGFFHNERSGWDYVVCGSSSQDYTTINRTNITGEVEVSSFQGPDHKPKGPLSFLFRLKSYEAYCEYARAQDEKRDFIQQFKSRALRFREQNLADIGEKIKPIRLYQGTIEEVERDLGKNLERVDTKMPETYIQRDDTFWLRVEAYVLGANAVVHYQPGSAIGTPVRFK